MKMNNSPKQLHRHTTPLIIIAAVFLIVAVLSINNQGITGSATTRGLVTHVVNIKSSPKSLAKVTLSGPDQAQSANGAGSYLNGGLSQAGRSAQAYLTSQTPVEPEN